MQILHHGTYAQFEEGKEGLIEIAKKAENCVPEEHAACVRSFGGFTALATIYVGNPDKKQHIYEALFRWAEDHNLPLSDTAIEEYLVDSLSSTNRRYFVTRIYLPLQGCEV